MLNRIKKFFGMNTQAVLKVGSHTFVGDEIKVWAHPEWDVVKIDVWINDEWKYATETCMSTSMWNKINGINN